jgi:hypothetical protein
MLTRRLSVPVEFADKESTSRNGQSYGAKRVKTIGRNEN